MLDLLFPTECWIQLTAGKEKQQQHSKCLSSDLQNDTTKVEENHILYPVL